MPTIPAIVEKRLKAEVSKFQKILSSALSRDVNEADTVVIITDMLEQVFGLDKYEDITREFSIQGTFVDLAVRTGGRIDYLIEVKAIGIPLKEGHLRQAIGYAAKEGVKWVVLTNGVNWQIHRVIVDGQVKNELLVAFNFLDLKIKNQQDLEFLFLLCKRAINKDLIEEFYEQKQAFNKFTIGALLATDEVAGLVKRTLRKINPGIKVTDDAIRDLITTEVIKREVYESDAGKEAQKQIKKEFQKIARQKQKSSGKKMESNVVRVPDSQSEIIN